MTATERAKRSDALYYETVSVNRRALCDMIANREADLEDARAENAKLQNDADLLRSMLQAKRKDAHALMSENAELRELVSGLEYCAQGFVCNRCPLYDPSGTNHRRCESLERELGIEVDA